MTTLVLVGAMVKALPHLLDLRAAALLSQNSSAALESGRALAACSQQLTASCSSASNHAACEAALLLQTLACLPSLPADAAGVCTVAVQQSTPATIPSHLETAFHALKVSGELCTTGKGQRPVCDVPRVAAAAAALLNSRDAVTAAAQQDGERRAALTACAAELSMRAACILQRLLSELCTAPSNPESLPQVGSAVAAALGGDGATPPVSVYAAAQLVALRAVEATQRAHVLAEELVSLCSTRAEVGALYATHLLIHTGQVTLLLLARLGLGMSQFLCSSG